MRRSKLEMYYDVLASIHYSPLKLTRIMYAANIGCSSLKKLLELLITKGYVQRILDAKDVGTKGTATKGYYRITPEGIQLIESIDAIRTTLNLETEQVILT